MTNDLHSGGVVQLEPVHEDGIFNLMSAFIAVLASAGGPGLCCSWTEWPDGPV